MELRHLRYFRAVGEELHFGRAATRLHMAQPPLSQQIRQLEQELGVKLLERSTRRVELTPAGEAYLAWAIRILDAVDVAAHHAQRIADGVQGRLAIGCVGSATYSLLPQLVRALHEELPGVDVSIRGEMLAPAQIAALLSGEIDLALLRPPVERSELSVQTIRRDRLLVALPRGHALASRSELSIADLRNEEFVVHAGHGRSVMNSIVTSICADAGFVPRVRHEVGETSTLLTLVAAGLGLAVVPHPTASLDIAGVCYRPLIRSRLGVDLVAAYAIHANLGLIARVLSILRNVAGAESTPG